jgi:hypothetical protein
MSQLSAIPAAIRDQIVQGMAGGNLSAGGMNISSDVPASISNMLMEMFRTQFANSLSSAMRVGILVMLIGAVASLFISSHIKRAKAPTE